MARHPQPFTAGAAASGQRRIHRVPDHPNDAIAASPAFRSRVCQVRAAGTASGSTVSGATVKGVEAVSEGIRVALDRSVEIPAPTIQVWDRAGMLRYFTRA